LTISYTISAVSTSCGSSTDLWQMEHYGHLFNLATGLL